MRKSELEDEFITQVMDAQGIIHKVCSVYSSTVEQRKDLFQEILIQLWKSYPSFRGEAKFSTWMYRVSLNVALQQFRKKTNKIEEYQLTPQLFELPEDAPEEINPEHTRLLHIAIAQLNDIEKAIIMLYLEEKEYEEIAEIVGITQNYVRVKMNRIKSKLKQILNPEANGTE